VTGPEFLADATRGGTLVLAGLFTLAAAHKARLVIARRAAEHPIVRSTPALYRHSVTALLGAASVEGVVIAALLVWPPAGVLATGLLASGYTVVLARLELEQDCECFGAFLRAPSRGAAIARNLAILTYSLLGFVVLITQSGGHGISARPVAFAVVAIAVLAGWDASHRPFRNQTKGGKAYGQ
jgi:hypothetical protein